MRRMHIALAYIATIQLQQPSTAPPETKKPVRKDFIQVSIHAYPCAWLGHD